MKALKTILLAGGATVALAVAAQAADLPTTKPPGRSAAQLLRDLLTWLNSTAGECPLGARITFYGQIDVGFGYETPPRGSTYYSQRRQ